MPMHRTDPEESLREVQKAEHDSVRGKLKIYLGSAPGVGKTYEMLHDAYENLAKHFDVVIGIVESHGRELIESMLKNFEIIPRQIIQYRGKTCDEFDLDAALKRNPGLILVDEMAHSNTEGLRHEKRWQDIKELLDRGIDVYTTLNVQHIESLKDDVAQIIQAAIKETVPDSMIERADTIELVDLPVDELLKRLHEGKIYIPRQAEFAVEHYFRRGNLIALRELALRTTAAAVETEVLLYRKSEGIKKIWPTKDKILVCVGANPESLKLIRTAKQLASSLQAEWIAIYVDIPRLHDADYRRNCAIKHLRLAQQLGAKTHVLIASDILKEIMRFARERNVTQIMVWKPARERWWLTFKRHIADKILSHCGEINVYIVTGEASIENRSKKVLTPQSSLWKYYAYSLGIVLLATGCNMLLAPYVATSNLLMLYLLGVMMVSLLGHIGPSILASISSVLLYDFLFLPSVEPFKSNNHGDIFTLIIMFIVTQVISYFTLLKHRKAEMAKQIQRQTNALYTLSQQLLLTRGVDALLKLGAAYIEDIFKAKVSTFLPKKSQLQHRSRGRFEPIQDEKEQSVAEWVYKMEQPAGLGTDTLSSSKALYLPLVSSVTKIGVLKVEPNQNVLYTPEQLRLLESCATQLTLALEVDRLQEKMHKKELQNSIDSARDSLLKNISAHLNFPLKVILTAIKQKNGQEFDPSFIHDELNRISLMNSNMRQLIEFESPTFLLNKTTFSLRQVIMDSITLFKKHVQHKSINLHWPEKMPKIFADRDLLREVLMNLIDNANKFSSHHSTIDIDVEVDTKQFKISITNQCSMLDNDEINRLFKKFYRGKKNSGQHGLGLGLTLCQKIIEAHQGKIWAENFSDNQVVVFRFLLPIT